MKKKLFFIALTVASITFFSCQKEVVTPASPQDDNIIAGKVDDPEGCPATEVVLVAGQTINSGSVTVSNDADYIYVTYTTTGGWLLTQTHLYVGDCALIPVNGPGNPIPGQFPYAATHNNINTYTYQVPISRIPAGACGCIAAHAVVVKLDESGHVVNQQTGWGQGTRINPNGGNWGMKFSYCSCTGE